MKKFFFITGLLLFIMSCDGTTENYDYNYDNVTVINNTAGAIKVYYGREKINSNYDYKYFEQYNITINSGSSANIRLQDLRGMQSLTAVVSGTATTYIKGTDFTDTLTIN